MASTNNQEEKKKKKNDSNQKNKAVATPTKKTPTKKTPVKKTPNQDQDKKKNKTGNGSVTELPEIIPSSSSDSQDIQYEIEEEHSPSTKPNKTNKRKQKAHNDEDEEGDGSMCKFPMARIKRIIKSEDASLQLPQDVVFLVNKATEKFIEQFCEEAYDCSVRDRKKALAYKHLSTVVSEKRRFDFLSDYVPEKLKAEAALEQRKLVENGQV